ncbi:hypothetical protein L211DRAFT_632858 [Terfezia boudieri ATCC MYA-4762]|uniref:Secreted protein n=1 Tax=Terfezia boudieri ATCC MYA-4762 TaxID=1051890 RepID=A0A3N4L928_9PEZI|nr:hypothetical protein L211DRAFT_632858 [Terfezia boudieri ATCC MYA-4762]
MMYATWCLSTVLPLFLSEWMLMMLMTNNTSDPISHQVLLICGSNVSPAQPFSSQLPFHIISIPDYYCTFLAVVIISCFPRHKKLVSNWTPE